jgi:hypothetical protein
MGRTRLLLAEFERAPNGDSAHLLAALKSTRCSWEIDRINCSSLFVCEVEAKKGLLVSSQRHLKTARTLLSTYSNPWLEGLASICDFCLAYLVGDLAAAERLQRMHCAFLRDRVTHEPSWRHLLTSLIFVSGKESSTRQSAVSDAPSR